MEKREMKNILMQSSTAIEPEEDIFISICNFCGGAGADPMSVKHYKNCPLIPLIGNYDKAEG